MGRSTSRGFCPGASSPPPKHNFCYQRRSEKYLLLTMMMDEKSEDTPFNREHITEGLWSCWSTQAERSLFLFCFSSCEHCSTSLSVSFRSSSSLSNGETDKLARRESELLLSFPDNLVDTFSCQVSSQSCVVLYARCCMLHAVDQRAGPGKQCDCSSF